MVKRGVNSAAMEARKLIAARYYRLKSRHELMAQYQKWIGKREGMKY
jgi:hypothetical protein